MMRGERNRANHCWPPLFVYVVELKMPCDLACFCRYILYNIDYSLDFIMPIIGSKNHIRDIVNWIIPN